MATRPASVYDGDIGRSFEEEWPELARQLERFLAAKGVEPWLRADVIQETATRLYPRWEDLDHSLPLWNLVATIAMRVVHNHNRKESRIQLVPDPVPIHTDDVHVRGLQRAQLVKTRAALNQLSTDQRRVLLAEVGEARVPAGTRNRINVLRLRARTNLREALGPWAPAGVTLRLRSLRTAIERRLAGWGPDAQAVSASIASAAVAATLIATGAGSGAAAPGGGLGPADPGQETIRQGPHVLGLHDIRDARLLRDAAAVARIRPRKLGSKAKQRAKKTADGQSALAQDPMGFVDDKREWAESRKEYTQGHARATAERHQDYAEGRKEYTQGHARATAERHQDYAESRKEWAEDKLP